MPLHSLSSGPSDGGQRQWKILLGLLSVGVILFGGLILVWSFRPEPTSAERRSVRYMWFQCEACGHQFNISPREFADQAAAEPIADMSRLGMGNCPSCGRKQCCRQTIQCVHCSRHFVPGRPEGDPADPARTASFRCPHCKGEFDLNQLRQASRRSGG